MTVGAQSEFRKQTLKIGVWSWKAEHRQPQACRSGARVGTLMGMYWDGRRGREAIPRSHIREALGSKSIRTVES